MNDRWLTEEVTLGPKSRFKQSDVEGIWVSDMHFSHMPPVARSIEKDWYKAQERCIEQLWKLKEEYEAPILCCGDIFHKALSPNELVNFLIPRLPKMYAIAGNHDLPFHSYEDIRKSAFWTLVEAGKIENIQPGDPVSVGAMLVHGFPYGTEITPPSQEPNGLMINVAMVHDYIWKDGKGFFGAPKSNHVKKFYKKLKGYSVAFFGDNHQAFKERYEDLTIVNIGGFQRRNIDERKLSPSAWLLHSNGKITRHKLDTPKDKFLDTRDDSIVESCINEMHEFIEELESTQQSQFDFHAAVKEYMTTFRIKGKLARELLQAIEGGAK